MNVFDKVVNVDNADITGIVVETTEIVIVKANSDMSTSTTTTVTKVKVLTFPAMTVISGTSDMWTDNV
jgi:hypothetical protein